MVRLQSQQDIWEHVGRFVVTHFPAAWTAFVQRRSDERLAIDFCTLPEAAGREHLLTAEVRTLIGDVLEHGFLASQVLHTPKAGMTVFLPIRDTPQPNRVMLVGHGDARRLPRELLNIYLAMAGLVGATIERLQSERELAGNRAHLEELVRERTAQLAKATRQNELILQSVGEGICAMDLDGKITLVNPFAARSTGWQPEELVGRNAHATFHHTRAGGHPYPQEECLVLSAISQGKARTIEGEEFCRKDGARFPVEITVSPLVEAGKVVGGVMAFRDITARKRAEELIQTSLREKEVLLKEIHHRVKNNLQVISSLVDLQADALKEPALRGVFADMRDRVRSMALVHEKLYQSESLARVEFAEYARSLLNSLWRAHADSAATVHLKLDLRPVSLSVITAIPCGLVLNELVTNALKHAFRGRSGNELTVELKAGPGGRVCLRVRDNGAGLPAGLDWRQSRSLGLRLVQMLARQLGGALEVSVDAGTEFQVTFLQPAPGPSAKEHHE
jgi:PAS domain S-box-containing protein